VEPPSGEQRARERQGVGDDDVVIGQAVITDRACEGGRPATMEFGVDVGPLSDGRWRSV
jgi:hypothetical protein